MLDSTSAARRLTVDGEVFEVSDRIENGEVTHDYAWLTGPNEGYGFSSGRSDGRPSDEVALIESIRGFLADINPDTGYLD